MAETTRLVSPLDKWKFMRVIMSDPRSVPSDVAVAFWLLEHMNGETGDCFPSYATVAKEARLDRKSVIAATRRLVERKLFHYRRGGPGKGANRYSANFGLYGLVVPTPPGETGKPTKPGGVVVPTPPSGGAHATTAGGAHATLTCEVESMKEPVKVPLPKKNHDDEGQQPSAGKQIARQDGARERTLAEFKPDLSRENQEVTANNRLVGYCDRTADLNEWINIPTATWDEAVQKEIATKGAGEPVLQRWLEDRRQGL